MKFLHPATWHVALESWQWIHQLAAPCNVIGGSGMICYWIHPNVRNIGILHLVSISTTSSLSTCHSAPFCEILSKSDHPLQKKMTSCRFSRWRISAILDFRGLIIGSLKSPCTTSYRSSIETIALNCLFLIKSRFFAFWRQTDKQTDRRTDEQHRCTKPGLKNYHKDDDNVDNHITWEHSESADLHERLTTWTLVALTSSAAKFESGFPDLSGSQCPPDRC